MASTANIFESCDQRRRGWGGGVLMSMYDAVIEFSPAQVAYRKDG